MKCKTVIGNSAPYRDCDGEVNFVMRLIGTRIKPDINETEWHEVCEKCLQNWLIRCGVHLEVKRLT